MNTERFCSKAQLVPDAFHAIDRENIPGRDGLQLAFQLKPFAAQSGNVYGWQIQGVGEMPGGLFEAVEDLLHAFEPALAFQEAFLLQSLRDFVNQRASAPAGIG
jgi:hypothetical protein